MRLIIKHRVWHLCGAPRGPKSISCGHHIIPGAATRKLWETALVAHLVEVLIGGQLLQQHPVVLVSCVAIGERPVPNFVRLVLPFVILLAVISLCIAPLLMLWPLNTSNMLALIFNLLV